MAFTRIDQQLTGDICKALMNFGLTHIMLSRQLGLNVL
jgi:hypothetical protein